MNTYVINAQVTNLTFLKSYKVQNISLIILAISVVSSKNNNLTILNDLLNFEPSF